LPGHRDDLAQFFEFLDHHDDLAAKFGSQEGHAHERRILVAVANNQAAELVLERQAGEELGFAADFQAKVKGLAGIENFLNHFAELVDFNGKNAAILALVVEFGDGVAKRQVNRFDPVPQDILESDQERKFQPAGLGFFDDVRKID